MEGIFAVTCRTAGCLSNNYTLILANPGDLVVCGVCSQQITDIQRAGQAISEENTDE